MRRDFRCGAAGLDSPLGYSTTVVLGCGLLARSEGRDDSAGSRESACRGKYCLHHDVLLGMRPM